MPGRRYPGRAEVDAAAARFRGRRAWQGEEGPRPRIVISGGMLQLTAPDLARRERTTERAAGRRAHRVDQEAVAELLAEGDPGVLARLELAGGLGPLMGAAALADDRPEGDQPYSLRGGITEWSAKSQANMWRVLASLDYSPILDLLAVGRVPGFLTLTLPGDWRAVVPDGRTWRVKLAAFRKAYQRAWGEPLIGPWKNEYQRRGAPHFLIWAPIPHGCAGAHRRVAHEAAMVAWEASGREGRRPYYRPAPGDGLGFRPWCSLVWANIVGARGEERARHLRAGTGVDVDLDDGLRALDPLYLMVYFAKHGAARVKAYQNKVPAGYDSPGRFWGYWGLSPLVAEAELTPAEQITAARVIRRYVASEHREGRPITRLVQVRRVDARTGTVRHRWARRRVRRMPGSAGFLVVHDAPRVAGLVARVLAADERSEQ